MIEIPLTKNQKTTVDVIDADLAIFKWCAQPQRSDYYAVRSITNPDKKPRQIRVSLACIILSRSIGRKLKPNEKCDHKNGNTLDNRRENLRLATNAQNGQNSKLYANNASGYKGVFWYKERGKWRAQIKVNGKQKFLGDFFDKEKAAEAYRIAAEKFHGEFARIA